MRVWGITDGSAGTVAQVKALAEALGYTPVLKTITIAQPLVWLPNVFYGGSLKRLLPKALRSFDTLAAPWPEMLISCGRRGALAALAVKQMIPPQERARIKLVHIHDPRMHAAHFDAVIAMQHDNIEAPNVIKTKFALHTITPSLLAEARQKFAKRFSAYTKPYVAVLLGGSTHKYTLTKSRMNEVIAALQRLLGAVPGAMLITTSRRTGYGNLQALLAAFPRMRESKAYVYDGIGDNPYLGMLALAEHIVVSNDSVNMMSEAVATGKPVYILKLPGHTNTKPARFAEMLIAEGFARPLDGKLESWSYAAEGEMDKLVAAIKPRLAA